MKSVRKGQPSDLHPEARHAGVPKQLVKLGLRIWFWGALRLAGVAVETTLCYPNSEPSLAALWGQFNLLWSHCAFLWSHISLCCQQMA